MSAMSSLVSGSNCLGGLLGFDCEADIAGAMRRAGEVFVLVNEHSTRRVKRL